MFEDILQSDTASFNVSVRGASATHSEPVNRTDVLRELAQEIRTLQTSNRSHAKSVSSGSPSLDACLPSRGLLAGSLLELLTDQGPSLLSSRLSGSSRARQVLTRGSGLLCAALRISREWLATGKYLVMVDTQLSWSAPALRAMQIPLERVILIRPDQGADWIWGIDQALRSRAVGALIASVDRLDDRVARRWQLAVENGGGLGIFLRDRVMAKRYPSWAEVQWQLRSLAPNTATSANAFFGSTTGGFASSQKVRGISPRWFDFVLQRAPGGRIGKRVQLGIGSDGDWVEYQQEADITHDRKLAQDRTPAESTVHLASQLAMAAARRRDVAAG
ncbi:MAG: hypothetical protein RL069_174 [Planctomycetota bacterium]